MKPRVRHKGYTLGDRKVKAMTFDCLAAFRAGVLFEDSGRGFERRSIDEDPRFRSIAADGVPLPTDDLRLTAAGPAGPGSPAIRAGVRLPPQLRTLDPVKTTGRRPDIGAYDADSGPVRVGVDGRRSFPASPGTAAPASGAVAAPAAASGVDPLCAD